MVVVLVVVEVLVLVELVVEATGDVVDASDVPIDGVTTPVADISDPHPAATTTIAIAKRVVRVTGSTVPDRSSATLAP
jgi:hypothetical protein